MLEMQTSSNDNDWIELVCEYTDVLATRKERRPAARRRKFAVNASQPDDECEPFVTIEVFLAKVKELGPYEPPAKLKKTGKKPHERPVPESILRKPLPPLATQMTKLEVGTSGALTLNKSSKSSSSSSSSSPSPPASKATPGPNEDRPLIDQETSTKDYQGPRSNVRYDFENLIKVAIVWLVPPFGLLLYA
jgi:hypothetical protein